MATTIPKLERLLNLVAALLHAARPLTADELRERIPGYPEEQASFKRAFERDKAELRTLGVPIRVEPVPGRMPAEDGYRVDPTEYSMPDLDLEPDELAALRLAQHAVRLDGLDGRSGLAKLGAGTGGPAGGTGGTGLATLPAVAHLGEVFAAVGARQRLGFRYRDKDRDVDPHRLHHEKGRWYLRATDLGAGEPRSFRLDRIEGELTIGAAGSATSVDAADTARGELRVDPWALGDDEPVTATVRIDASHAVVASRSVGPHVPIEWHADGSITLAVEVRSVPGFRSFVLGFLDAAEIVEPEALRDDLVAWLDAVADGATS